MPVQPLRHARSMMCRSSQSLMAIIFLAMWLHPARAGVTDQDLTPSMFSFNGFGTLGVVHSSDNQADFVSNAFQSKGAGFTNSWSGTPDTKLGIQLNAALTDRLSAVVQVMSQYQYNGTFRPDLEWGNVKYLVTPDLSIRAGRIAIPTFMDSDTLTLGYALPFVRIPLEIFANLPVTHSDGADGSYRTHLGSVTNTVQAFLGGFDLKLADQGAYEAHGMRGIADTVEFGSTTLHFSYQTLRYDLSYLGLVLNQVSQQIATIGADYDPGKWFVSGEVVRAPDEAFGVLYGAYVYAGRRFQNVTPYLGYARAGMTRVGSLGFTPFINQDTNTLGVRWDLRKNIDFKAQLDRTVRRGGFNEFYLNQQPGFKERGTDEVLTLLVDFVF
jgi:hypothetical protein